MNINKIKIKLIVTIQLTLPISFSSYSFFSAQSTYFHCVDKLEKTLLPFATLVYVINSLLITFKITQKDKTLFSTIIFRCVLLLLFLLLYSYIHGESYEWSSGNFYDGKYPLN